MTSYLLKRYEICFATDRTLHPTYFDASKWTKGKYVTQLQPLLAEFAPMLAVSARVENVTCQIFSFATAQERTDWKNSLLIPHREFGRLCRLAQTANGTVNLFFDFEETVEGEGVPNIADIKASTYNRTLTPYALAQQKDLLAPALKLQF